MDKTFAHIALREESAERIRQAIRDADLTALKGDPYYAIHEDPDLANIGDLGEAGERIDPKAAELGDLIREPETGEKAEPKVTELGDLAKEPETGEKAEPKITELGDLAEEPATGRMDEAAGRTGRGRAPRSILRFLPLAAAAAILLMLAVPRIFPARTDGTGEISTIEKPDNGEAYMEGSQTPAVTSPLIVGQALTAEAAAASLQAYYGEACLVEVASETDGEAVLDIRREGEETVTAVISLEDGAVAIRSASGELLSEGVIKADGTYEEKK